MAYGIRRSEGFGAAFRRLIIADIAAARDHLRDPALSPEDGVHLARRRLKRIRSVIGILRPALKESYAGYKFDIKKVAQSLAVFRDADVLRATATDLRAAAGSNEQRLIERAIGALARPRANPRARTGTMYVLHALRELEIDAEDLPVANHGRRLLEAAIARAYRRGRRAMKRARKSADPADFHAWRKEAKDLWHLLVVARKRLPRKLRRYGGRIDVLAEILGLDHDYWLTGEHIAAAAGDQDSQTAARRLVTKRRQRLQTDALGRGARLYRRRLRAFMRSIRLR